MQARQIDFDEIGYRSSKTKKINLCFSVFKISNSNLTESASMTGHERTSKFSLFSAPAPAESRLVIHMMWPKDDLYYTCTWVIHKTQ